MPSLRLMPPAPAADTFTFGTARNPAGSEITADSVSLLLDGRRWMPVMGEMHYTRVPADRWREELLKMKAGGIDCVAAYVFWIHHEETEGVFNWSGDHDYGRFVRIAAEVGLKVAARIGPWCHGEVRNGGLPDWLVARFGDRARTNDPEYLAVVRRFFTAIHAQIADQFWKDGGPVVVVQIENEYFGPAEHLLAIKRLAIEIGFDAPLYTRTGWFDPCTPVPFGELLPLYGAYPEGFWDREITPMPNVYPANFRFSPERSDAGIASDLKGGRESADAADTARYPFLTCEIGGGMMSSYHRRIRIDPRDIETVVASKLGSGGNLPGYYMYHGGINPPGITPLQESQATGYWNDMPEKNYDFQAPIGAAGQLRPHYHRLRRLSLFVHDHGETLAGMPTRFPDERPASLEDATTLRWAVRSDGRSGFVFINNYERLRPMPAKPDVRFELTLAEGGNVVFPSKPVTFPADTTTIWPFGLDLAPGVRLDHATARLLCHIDEGKTRTIFFSGTPGVPAEFAFNGGEATTLPTGRDIALTVDGDGEAKVHVVLLDDADSLAFHKAVWRGRERVFLTRACLVVDGDELRLQAENAADLRLCVFPDDNGETEDGVFTEVPLKAEIFAPITLTAESIQPAGPAREVTLGTTTPPVALAPLDADFDKAAIWRLRMPASVDRTPLLRIRYQGDVVRLHLDGRFVFDDFYNGDVVELDVSRHAGAEVTLFILPLRPDAPILLPEGTRPDAPVAKLLEATLLPVFRASHPLLPS